MHEAFARALKYNLDGRVKLIEEALAQDDLDLSRYDLLPKAYVNAAFNSRNNVNGELEPSAIATGQQSLVPSTSTDNNVSTADLLVSWNILDFGVSYFAARQQTDRVLIGQEERRKVIQSLLQDVRRAFWRAASAQRLSGQIAESIRAAEAALPDARKVETEGLRSPVNSLRYQKALLDLIRQLEGAQSLLAVSKTELAQLINLPPGQPYSLAVPRDLRVKSVPLPIGQMEETALLLNPDIRELSYQKRISVDETHKALLRLLPGITFSYDPNYDSNSFLVNHYWATERRKTRRLSVQPADVPGDLPARRERRASCRSQARGHEHGRARQAAHRLSAISVRPQGFPPGAGGGGRRSAPLRADPQPQRHRCRRRPRANFRAGECADIAARALSDLRRRPRRRWVGSMPRWASTRCRRTSTPWISPA